jgi:DNA adenine methylase
MYRLNREGNFNVPYGGGQRTPSPLWEKALLKSASQALNGANLRVSDFENILSEARLGDVVYCDPTYTVVHENNGFVRYNEINFSWADQKRLALAARQANTRGAVVIINNACHLEIRQLYWPIKPITRGRYSLISPRVSSRRAVQEYLFVLENK